jgi:putative Mn2+ efflux pump MntP
MSMFLKTIISKLNWRLIIIHIIATTFVIYGVRQFAWLTDLDLYDALSKYGIDFQKHLHRTNDLTDTERWSLYFNRIFYTCLTALILSFIISLTFTIKWEMHWLNPVLVLIAGFLFYRLRIFNYSFYYTLANFIGDLFSKFGREYPYIINGAILITIGLFFFFSRWTKNYIRKNNLVNS